MEVVEIKPNNQLIFKIPNGLTTKFRIGNLTLRSVCIYIVTLHPHIISFNTKYTIIDAFQETEITAMLHWSQEVNCQFKSKIRVYIWQLYDEQVVSSVIAKMFNKENDGNCLLFEQLTAEVEIDNTYLQRLNSLFPQAYSISRVYLPNQSSVAISEEMMHKVLTHCEKVSKVKAIYTYGSQYVVEFSQMEDVVASFCQVRDSNDRLALFGIGCIPTISNIVYSPNLLILTYAQTDSPKISFKKQKQDSHHKQFSSKKQFQQQQKPHTKTVHESAEKHLQQHGEKIKQFSEKQTKQRKVANRNKNRDIVKQSFVVQQRQLGITRKRTKSQQLIIDNDCQYQTTSIDVQTLNEWREWRAGKDFQTRKIKQFQQKSIDVMKKILNIALSTDQKSVYLLLRDCVMICETENLSNKKIIKFDGIDTQNTHLPTPMIIANKQKMLIFANESYLFWVSLTGQQEPDWKYVQRKQIYTIQVVEQLNLLMVGGKNFSKLSYLGKSTSRSNIKVYSCGKHGKRDHLHTYDIPQCNGENVIQMKYIVTKPNGTKLLLVLTHQNKLYFLRVRAFNHIEVYSSFQTNQIGIQQIVSMNYHIGSSILICLQKLSEQKYCFKQIKVNCSYEKVQISTQSIKLPVMKYSTLFRLGGKQGNEWITAIDSHNCIYSLYLEWKEAQKTEYQKPIKDCLLVKKGAIFRQITQVLSRIIKD